MKNKARIRKKVDGDLERPRLSVFRSGRHIYAQIIDDSREKLWSAFSTLEGNLVKKKDIAPSKWARDRQTGFSKNIKNVVFDRSGYVFHGRVKAVAEGAREAGLSF